MSDQHQQPPLWSHRQEISHLEGSMQEQLSMGTQQPRTEDIGREIKTGDFFKKQMYYGERRIGEPSIVQHQSMESYGHSYRPGQPLENYHTYHIPITIDGTGKQLRTEGDSSQMSTGAPSMVGMEGMPEPAAKPYGPKLKFTPEDDALLVDLKENKSLTWKQIADFFPGRSSGTLQVRYCTKLKALSMQWTDENIQKLQAALHNYEQEKWSIIAKKVGIRFTSNACRDKAKEL